MKKRIVFIVSMILVIVVGSSFIYLNDSYPPTKQKLDASLTMVDDKNIIITNSQIHKKAIVLYPGGKVEPLAYQSFMGQFAKEGFLVVIAKMPFNLAVLNSNKLDDIINEHPEIEDWYLIGHSLGGAMGANYIADHPQDIEGLYLLASYPTKDLKDFKGKMLSIIGEKDCVLNMESYEENKKYLPTQVKEHIIMGGNHAQFGNYGKQRGDCEAIINQQQQQEKTFDLILKSINE